MTAIIISSTQVNVTVTITSDILISRIVMYVLIADLTDLLV